METEQTINKITLNNDYIKTFKDIFKTIEKLGVSELKLNFNENSFKTVTMDNANISMTSLEYYSSNFMAWNFNKQTFGFNLTYFNTVLRRIKTNTKTAIDLSIARVNNHLNLNIKDLNNNGITRNFNIPLIDVDTDTKEPELNFKVKCQIDSKILKDIVKELDKSLTVELTTIKDTLFIRQYPDNQFKEKPVLDFELKNNDSVVINPNSILHEPIRSLYCVDYFKIMVNTFSDTIFLSYSNDYPLMIEYKEVDKFHLTFIIAPRLDV